MAWKVDERILEDLFITMMIEKANTIKEHLKNNMNRLIIVTNIGPTMAVFKIYDIDEEDSLKLKMTLSNLGDIKDQTLQLWQQMNLLLQQYCPICKSYSSTEVRLPGMEI